MAERQLPSPELLRKLLRYDRRSGKLYWRARPLLMFSNEAKGRTWNTKWAGKEAFTSVDSKGYRQGQIFAQIYRGHRVAWAVLYGEQPPTRIDHRDGNKCNNRPLNMRAATPSQNARNSKKSPNRTSRFKGVGRKRGGWRAYICLDREYIHLGHFSNEEDAARAYDIAAMTHYGEFARTNFGGMS